MIFVGWWNLLIVAVASLAIASKLGFDPLESLPITNSSMKGRLILNLSIFNNPNGLGHSVVPAIPMLYYYLIWKRPMASRALGVALLFLPLYCIYLTVSKGAFLCAGITSFATMTIGRPKRVQVAMAIFAALFGTGLLFALPRMNELNKSKSDPAIQGRVAAFKHGYQILQTRIAGVGKGQWGQDNFMTDYVTMLVAPKPGQTDDKARKILKPIHYNKAPHSSYVCTGGELGIPGLFLFVGVLYCCLRTTISARTQTPDEERIRRMLFVLVVSYIVSGWMVDFEYRPTFFMFTAAIAALHRHLMGLSKKPEVDQEEASPEIAVPVWRAPQVLPPAAWAGLSRVGGTALLAPELEADPAPMHASTALAPPIARNWNRLGLFDLGAIAVLTYAVIRFWAYIMARM
jgi:O-antigen ligase